MRRAFFTQDDSSSLRTSGAPRCAHRESDPVPACPLDIRIATISIFSWYQIGSFGRAHRFADWEGRSRATTEGKLAGKGGGSKVSMYSQFLTLSTSFPASCFVLSCTKSSTRRPSASFCSSSSHLFRKSTIGTFLSSSDLHSDCEVFNNERPRPVGRFPPTPERARRSDRVSFQTDRQTGSRHEVF